jgi:hypothetical protein
MVGRKTAAANAQMERKTQPLKKTFCSQLNYYNAYTNQDEQWYQ